MNWEGNSFPRWTEGTKKTRMCLKGGNFQQLTPSAGPRLESSGLYSVVFGTQEASTPSPMKWVNFLWERLLWTTMFNWGNFCTESVSPPPCHVLLQKWLFLLSQWPLGGPVGGGCTHQHLLYSTCSPRNNLKWKKMPPWSFLQPLDVRETAQSCAWELMSIWGSDLGLCRYLWLET